MGLPINREDTMINAGGLPCLPARIGGHRADDGHPICLLVPHEEFSIRVAAVDQMRLREEGVLGQGRVDRVHHLGIGGVASVVSTGVLTCGVSSSHVSVICT
jgi:hypothetical protein